MQRKTREPARAASATTPAARRGQAARRRRSGFRRRSRGADCPPGRPRTRRDRRTRPGRDSPPRAARRSSGPCSTIDVADLPYRRRRALEQLQRRVVADQFLDSRSGSGRRSLAVAASCSGCVSSAVTPLPTTFTVASWPALSSSVQVVMSSSSVRRAPSLSTSAISELIRSSPGALRRIGDQTAQVLDELRATPARRLPSARRTRRTRTS